MLELPRLAAVSGSTGDKSVAMRGGVHGRLLRTCRIGVSARDEYREHRSKTDAHHHSDEIGFIGTVLWD